MRNKIFFVFCFVAIMSFSGCSWFQGMFQEKSVKSASELARDGMEEFKEGNYNAAIENFEKLRDWYPFDRYAILAELKIADSHYELQHYEEAVFAYQEFENLHPLNEAIPYVIYRTGRCYYERMDSVDRDQSSARKALETFERLRKQFPGHQYSKRAGEHVHACLKSLAGHEFYVGVYYYKTKHYKAALNRFKTVLYDFPDVGMHRQAMDYIALCEQAIVD
jgi:outer membrane protein assembly factor BamD